MVPVLLQYVLVRLASHLTARATAMSTQRLRLVHEMLVHIRLVKMTMWESVLSKHLIGELFKAVRGGYWLSYNCSKI
jgi:hypothetical protein